HGDPALALPNVVNLSFPGLEDGDEIVERLEGIAAVATGSACTSVCATASHVLEAMGVPTPELDGAIRISWSHQTDERALDLALGRMRETLLLIDGFARNHK